MNRIFALANWKVLLPLFVLFLGFFGYGFPSYQKQLNQLAGEEVVPLDIRASYTKEDVTQLFDTMGEEGRGVYQIITSRLDMLYPVVYSSFFALLLAFFLNQITSPNSKWRWLFLLPFFAAIFDYLENINVLKLLAQYPEVVESQVAFGSQMTSIKWLFVAATLLSVGILAMWMVVKMLFKR